MKDGYGMPEAGLDVKQIFGWKASGSGVGSLLDQRARISLEMVGRALALRWGVTDMQFTV